APAENGKLKSLDLRRVPDGSVYHGARQPAVLHRRSHQSADTGDVAAVRQRHYVDRPRRSVVDRIQHALRHRGALFVLAFFHQHGDRGSGEFRCKQRPHLVRHMRALAVELLDRIRYRGDLDQAESLHQRVAGGLAVKKTEGHQYKRCDKELHLHSLKFRYASSRISTTCATGWPVPYSLGPACSCNIQPGFAVTTTSASVMLTESIFDFNTLMAMSV